MEGLVPDAACSHPGVTKGLNPGNTEELAGTDGAPTGGMCLTGVKHCGSLSSHTASVWGPKQVSEPRNCGHFPSARPAVWATSQRLSQLSTKHDISFGQWSDGCCAAEAWDSFAL